MKNKFIIDYTNELNTCECLEKEIALFIIEKYFDKEFSENKEGVKHYPMDFKAKTPEELADKIYECCKTIWMTVLVKLGNIDFTKEDKIGKIIFTTPNMFSGFENDGLKPYLFGYDDYYQAEINFSVFHY